MHTLTMRPYQNDEDYWSIRAFLREVFLRDHRRELGWQVSRFDYWRWHMIETCQVVESIAKATVLWETRAGQLAAVLVASWSAEIVLTIHPDFQSPELEENMIAEGEKRFGTPGKRFFVLVHDRHPARQDILLRRGYTVSDGLRESQWRRDLTTPLPTVPVPAGYAVRPIGDLDSGEWPQRSWVSWRAFHPDEPDEAYEGWEWSLNWPRSPLYRRDLDIVAIAPDQQVAAYCVLWYDDVTRTALFDPVAVTPEHQRRGLGRAILLEAMHRAQRMGATLATVSGFEPGPNALYSATLSPDCDVNVPWVKVL